MKKLIGLCSFVLLLSTSAFSQALTFDIHNETGIDLYGVFVSPNEDPNWGEDVLPTELFSAETTVKIDIGEDYGESCSFDVKVTDGEGSEIVFEGVDLCELRSIILYEDGSYD
ncbi:MAG: hypothetical protein GY810_11750, partial [Aureispira sp.]|nr:hypothetical protein [Aureispira sp.]